MRYAVVRAIHSPTAGDVRTARLVVADVPDKTSVPDVAAALERRGRAAEFSEGGVPFGNHEIRAEQRNGWPKGIAALESAEVVTWDQLTREPVRGEGKRVTLRLTPAEHSTFTLCAERAGVSLQVWCMDALTRAAVADSPGARNGRAQAQAAEATS